MRDRTEDLFVRLLVLLTVLLAFVTFYDPLLGRPMSLGHTQEAVAVTLTVIIGGLVVGLREMSVSIGNETEEGSQ